MMKAMKDIPKFCAEVIYINQLKKKLNKLSEKLNNVMLDKVNEYPESKRIHE
jgi:tetrahydromethanopterin S-methyltransferase subunit G